MAPYGALDAVQRIIGDELRHTRLCAAVVDWLGGWESLHVDLGGQRMPRWDGPPAGWTATDPHRVSATTAPTATSSESTSRARRRRGAGVSRTRFVAYRMALDLNPQARQMADESMERTLAAQAEAIWPQEEPLLRRHRLPEALDVLDAGCGTGEASARIATAFPAARVLGVDILDAHLENARARTAHAQGRVRFERRSIFDLGLADASFDLTVCRHVVHSIPEARRALAELVRVTRPGGVVHVIAEDYGMIHFPRRRLDPGVLWPTGSLRYGMALGIDMTIGRRAPALLTSLGLERVTVDYVIVDTLRVPREVFARIWEAWRDGYADVLAEHLGMRRQEVIDHFDDQLATLRDPVSYAAWILPVVAGVVPLTR